MRDVIQKLRSLSNIKAAAQAIRKSLLEAEFGLEDKFCDAQELKESWENIVLPTSVCAFFSILFDINQIKLMTHNLEEHSSVSDGDDSMDEGDNDGDSISETRKSQKLSLSIK